MTVQTSFFDEPASTEPGASPCAAQLAALERHRLARGAWVDLLPGWLGADDDLLPRLLDEVDWYAEERQMYDRIVATPRLLAFYGDDEPLPHPTLTAAREALNEHYAAELGEPFTTAGLCLYRDGRDSVAWHGDTVGRGRSADTMVAIISLGSPRDFALRPHGGGTLPVSGPDETGSALRHRLQHGDLIVMGGSCQRTWDHAIPKTTQPVGPRVSIQFRPTGVR